MYEKEKEKGELKMDQFPQFGIVSDHSGHRFAKLESDLHPTATNAVMKEWKILEKALPETIYVRAYSDRVDLLRAVIIGPPKTPYHDGLFFFDFKFPKEYPNEPPLAHYHSFGLRLNPNLYASGKVCLSLLNTWSGPRGSRWQPKVSTMLQVLVSIQGLVLQEWPYYNEPDPIHRVRGPNPSGYNNMAYRLSCKTMLCLLRRPPKNFEMFITQHFQAHSRAILTSCQAYLNGFSRAGSYTYEYQADNARPFNLDQKNRLHVDAKFARDLEEMYGMLLSAFSRHDPSLIGFSEELHRTVEDAKKILPPPKPSLVMRVLRTIFGWIVKYVFKSKSN